MEFDSIAFLNEMHRKLPFIIKIIGFNRLRFTFYWAHALKPYNLQWFRINTLCSRIHRRCRCCYIYHSLFSVYLRIHRYLSLTFISILILLQFHPGFFSSFVVKADKIKSHIIFTRISPTAKASIHAPLNWPILVIFF